MSATNQANAWAKLIEQGGPEGDPYIPASYHYYRMLTNSEGVSTEMGGVDVVSGSQQTFGVTADSGHNVAIFQVTLSLFDTAIANDGFGGLAAFANGLQFQILSNDVGSRAILKDFTPDPIKRTGDLSLMVGPDGEKAEELGQGEDHVGFRWNMTDGGGHVFLADGEMFGLSLQDSTTGLTSFKGMVHGIQYPDQ